MFEPRELPILFSSPMVRATLDRSKTETRRVVKPQPWDLRAPPHPGEAPGAYGMIVRPGEETWSPLRSPYGQAGDLLYVRETWAALECGSYEDLRSTSPKRLPQYVEMRYRADDSLRDSDADVRGHVWRPGIHMPKRLARIWLRVEEVRVARLQAITYDDILAEGVAAEPGCSDGRLLQRWVTLWDGINGKRNGGDYAWVKDPRVWVVRYELASKSGRAAVAVAA